VVPAGCWLCFFLSRRVFWLVPTPAGHSRCLCHGYKFMTCWKGWSVFLAWHCELTLTSLYRFSTHVDIALCHCHENCMWLSATHKQYKMDGEVTLKEDSASTVGLMLATVCCFALHSIHLFLFHACLFCVHVYSLLRLVTGVAHLQVWSEFG